MISIYITYNGCQMRGLDSSRLHEYFILNNAIICDDPISADHIVFVSCSVNERSINHSIALIDKFKKTVKSNLIIIGCFPAISPEKLDNIFHGTTIRLQNINDIDKIFPDFKIKFNQVRETSVLKNNRADNNKIDISSGIFLPYRNALFFENYFKMLTLKLIQKKTAFLKISNGCNNQCSYCNIKKAVGSFVSKPIEELINEYGENINLGIRQFVIIGDDTGGYGSDLGVDLPFLLDNLIKNEKGKKVKWIFDEINPQWLLKYQDYFLKLAKENKINNIICPIQSGSQRIINLMGRPYEIKDIIDLLSKMRNISKQIELHTHVIIGFPTETHEDFLQTYSIFEGLELFKHTLVSTYYEFVHTKSYNISPKVSSTEISNRKNQLTKLLDIKKISYILS